MDIRPSHQKPFSGTKETRPEEEKIEHAIRKVQGAKGWTISVLFLFVWIDTLTTHNTSWADLISRFKGVDFFLTSVCHADLVKWYPSVFKSPYDFAWAHLSVAELRAAARCYAKEPAETTLFRDITARYTGWIPCIRRNSGSKMSRIGPRQCQN
jgi:hypothetical protein